MKTAIAVILGTACLVACGREKPVEPIGITMVTRSTQVRVPRTSEELKATLIERRPDAAKSIDALDIKNDSGVVTIRGHVADETVRTDLVKYLKSMTGVKSVRDELEVDPAPGSSMARTHAIRKHMHEALPESDTIIRGLILTDDGEVITISGTIPDEEAREALLKAAHETPNVKGVKDEMKLRSNH